MDAEEIVRLHTDGFNKALMEQDYKSLESIYSDDYMLVRPNGTALNKHQVLADLRENGLRFVTIELRGTAVRVFGSCAVLTAESETVSSRDGKTARSRFRLVAVYAEERDAVRLVHFQSTSLP